jgi:hypothetical protein
LLIHPLEQLTSAVHTLQSEGHCQNIFALVEQPHHESVELQPRREVANHDEEPQRAA